jgi:uncharacterized protein YkwD
VERRNVRPVVVLVILVFGYRFLPDLLPAQQFEPSGRDSARIGWIDPIETSDLALDIYERVNDERSARGLPRLAWHEGLADIGRRWSVEMIETGSYVHSSQAYRAHPGFLGTGENIHMGPLGATEAHVDWMESDGHRLNILEADYDAIGIGVVCRRDGRMWATQIFGVSDTPGVPRPVVDTGPSPIVRVDRGPMCPVRSVLGVPSIP